MAFFGTVEHALDDKNRIRIPKRFREAFPEGERIYFMKYEKGCIAVYSESVLNARIAEYTSVKSDQPDLGNYKRAILSRVELIEEDAQGRTVLSASMRAHAHITKNAVTIGMYDYLEIWSPEELEKEQAGVTLDEALLHLPM